MATTEEDWLVSLRRELHRRPEPAWREFYTTARIVEELRELPVDEVLLGPEMLAGDHRLAVPDESTLDSWLQQAREYDLDQEVLEELAGGYTGAMAVLRRGEGPTIGLRVDIDGLPQEESEDDDHYPVEEGFRSTHDGHMHACGHDGHATIGLGVLRAIADSDFRGTLKVFFQPAEEIVGGGKAVAEGGHLDDLDALVGIHLGLDHPTGEIVAGVDGFLAVSHFNAEFEGEPAHAGGHPEQGRNAVQAMATAVQNLYAIPRHDDGATRINAGKVGGGTASNIIPEEAFIEGEVRGETTELMEYTREKAVTVLESAAAMHDCEVTVTGGGEAPSATSDEAVVEQVASAAEGVPGVRNIVRRDDLGGSEDATYLMQRVQDNGGIAGFVGIGTDHPGGHHTSTFDVDEESLRIGVDVVSGAIQRLATNLQNQN
ncbi:amidohydrolase [Halovenus sp. WSH3]|uniref:Amidohydrolase n=1 Tax=Halovenus carboxidivorans TaxID=2692199 RepID=A0A6B0TE48_9EURY|nr:amidohydrolase [Halovenus carboxidivorans]MXR51479.1 amidohydrolase [Halovenus carboxidivorans]